MSRSKCIKQYETMTELCLIMGWSMKSQCKISRYRSTSFVQYFAFEFARCVVYESKLLGRDHEEFRTSKRFWGIMLQKSIDLLQELHILLLFATSKKERGLVLKLGCPVGRVRLTLSSGGDPRHPQSLKQPNSSACDQRQKESEILHHHSN
jgi:hypothetical protein